MFIFSRARSYMYFFRGKRFDNKLTFEKALSEYVFFVARGAQFHIRISFILKTSCCHLKKNKAEKATSA